MFLKVVFSFILNINLRELLFVRVVHFYQHWKIRCYRQRRPTQNPPDDLPGMQLVRVKCGIRGCVESDCAQQGGRL